jgi:hypothetical protein
MNISRSKIFTLRGFTLFVFFLMAVLVSAQEDAPVAAEEGAEEMEEKIAPDEHDECPKWAYKGDCDEKSAFMWKECDFSCDNHETCSAYAASGNCASNNDFMIKNCARYCEDEKEL